MLSQKQILTLFMIRNSQQNTLSDLAVPKELLIFEIGRYSVNTLLEYVIHANYYEMAKMLREYPMLMFNIGTAQDIDGQMITTTPFGHALKILDTYAWKLCYAIASEDLKNRHIYLPYFQEYAQNFNVCIDLTELQISYAQYLDEIDLHKVGQCTLEKLKETWLNVGMAQRKHVPRHMLREMSALNVNLEMIMKDVVLLTAEPNKDLSLDYLKQVSQDFNGCPILVNEQRAFTFYRVNVLRELHRVSVTELPFKHIAFPDKPNMPILKKVSRENCKEFFDYYGPWQNLYTVNLEDFIPFQWSNIDIISETGEENKFDVNETEFNLLDLGEKYTLARGAARDWFGTAFPLGMNKMLNIRATHDLRSFGNLLKLRHAERERFFEEILEAKQEDEISNKLGSLKKMKIK